MKTSKWSLLGVVWTISAMGGASADDLPLTPRPQTLQETLQAAYQNSLAREAAQAGLQAGYEALSATKRSIWVPGVQLKTRASATSNRQNTSVFLQNDILTHSQQNALSGEFVVQQNVFQGGAGIASIESAHQDVKALEAQTNNTLINVLWGAANAHLQLWAARGILKASEHKAMVYAKQLEVATIRFEAGEEKRSAVESIRAKYEAAQAEHVNQKGEVQVAVSRYIDLVGEEPAQELAKPVTPPMDFHTLEMAVEVALAKSPSLLQADALASKAKAQSTIAQAGLLPNASIGLQGNQGLNTVLKDNAQQQRSSSLGVWAELTIPLDVFGTTQASVRSKNYEAAQKRLEARNARRDIAQKVTEAWTNRQKAINSLAPANAAVKASSLALADVQEQYAVGEASYLDVIEAEDESYKAQTDLIKTEQGQVDATYKVLAVVGVLPEVVVGTEEASKVLQAPESHLWGLSIPDTIPEGVDPVVKDIAALDQNQKGSPTIQPLAPEKTPKA